MKVMMFVASISGLLCLACGQSPPSTSDATEQQQQGTNSEGDASKSDSETFSDGFESGDTSAWQEGQGEEGQGEEGQGTGLQENQDQSDH